MQCSERRHRSGCNRRLLVAAVVEREELYSENTSAVLASSTFPSQSYRLRSDLSFEKIVASLAPK
jgi:hypothetical protein